MAVAKRETGKGEKPSDCWTVPLCNSCHREQHGGSEMAFWLAHYDQDGLPLDVHFIALALWAATGDYERGLQIIQANR